MRERDGGVPFIAVIIAITLKLITPVIIVAVASEVCRVTGTLDDKDGARAEDLSLACVHLASHVPRTPMRTVSRPCVLSSSRVCVCVFACTFPCLSF